MNPLKRRDLFIWFILMVVVLLSYVIRNNTPNEINHIVRFVVYMSWLTFLSFSYYLLIKKGKLIISNFVLLLLLILITEISCFFLLDMPPENKKKFKIPEEPPTHIIQQVGNVHLADSVYHDVMENDNGKVFDVKYTIDHFQNRHTPDHNTARTRFAVFLGCSICFGIGLEDNQTLPYYFQMHASDFNSYNMASPGHGTNHMLAKLNYFNLNDFVKEKSGIGVYVFFWDHIYRALGTMRRYSDWLSGAPNYEWKDRKIVRDKLFMDGRPFSSWIYEKIFDSTIIQYFEIDFPPKLNDSHFDLVTEMIRESQKAFKNQTGSDQFVVLIYPSYRAYTDDEMEKFLSFLNGKNIRYVDLSSFIEFNREYSLGDDPHPNAQTNNLLAKELVARLDKIKW